MSSVNSEKSRQRWTDNGTGLQHGACIFWQEDGDNNGAGEKCACYKFYVNPWKKRRGYVTAKSLEGIKETQ